MQNHFLVHGKLVFRSYQLKLLALLGGLLILLMTTAPAWSESKPFMDPLIQASKARAELVQSVQKSVVHIKVEQKLVNVMGPFQNQPHQEGSGSVRFQTSFYELENVVSGFSGFIIFGVLVSSFEL